MVLACQSLCLHEIHGQEGMGFPGSACEPSSRRIPGSWLAGWEDGETYGDTLSKLKAWATHFLDFNLSHLINLLDLMTETIEATGELFNIIKNPLIKLPRVPRFNKNLGKLGVLIQNLHRLHLRFAFECWYAVSTSKCVQGQESWNVFL